MFRSKTKLPAALLESDLARVVPADELRRLDAIGTHVHVPAGRTLIRQHTAGREALVVIDGSLVVVRDGEEVATLGAGDVVGEVALLNGSLRNASVTVGEAAGVYAFNRREFAALLDACPIFASHVQKTADTRVLANA